MEKRETLGKKFNFDVEEFRGDDIDDIALGTRTHNCLQKAGIKTVADLLMWSYEELSELKGFGNTCHDEVDRYLQSKAKKQKILDYGATIEIKKFLPEIINGDFSFADQLSQKALNILQPYKEAVENVDCELLKSCLYEPYRATDVRNALIRFYKKIDQSKVYIDRISKVNSKRLEYQVGCFINAYTDKEEKRKELLFNINPSTTLLQYIHLVLGENHKDTNGVISDFLKWCSFDIVKDLKGYIEEIKKNPRNYQVLCLRAKKNTLEQVGKEFGVTRERIRQIDAKEVRKFAKWQRRSRLMMKIYADRNGDNVLTLSELSEYFGENTKLFIHLYENVESGEFIYDSQLEAFIIGDESMLERAQEYVDSLPDTFHESKKDEFVRMAGDELGISDELVQKMIEENYKKTGELLHRSRLTLEKIYAKILQKYYPNGMHVYDSTEIATFKEYIKQDYGIEVVTSDRAIGAILGRIGILCGRGRYRLNDKPYISAELAEKIRKYIENEETPIFLTNTVFSVFEDELIDEGIDNKYFLQGVLHELYGDRWIFRRDYISKDEAYTSVYTSIVNFIKNANHPVSKEEIFNAIPGVTEIVVNISVSDPDILNLFGVYIHSSKLSLSKTDIEYLHNQVEKALMAEGISHCKEVYEQVNRDYPALLKNNYVLFPFSMYSLLEYLFRDEFQFSRPFVALEGVEIDTINDVLKQMVAETDEVRIAEIMDFAKTHHLIIANVLEFIDSCSETHLLINNEVVRRIELIGVNETIANTIEEVIYAEIEGTVPISHLSCTSDFPKISVPWTEWLIYSVINKWSSRLDVAPSANQFRQAIPLIAKKGKLETEMFENTSKDEIGNMVVADDINDIDNLISGYIIDDIGGFDEL